MDINKYNIHFGSINEKKDDITAGLSNGSKVSKKIYIELMAVMDSLKKDTYKSLIDKRVKTIPA